jgi:hypothetical protein
VGVHVHPVGEREYPLLALRPGLKPRLEEQAEGALGVHEIARVLERKDRLPVHDAADDAVEVIGAGEQRELADGVEPAVGQPTTTQAPDPSQLEQERVGAGHGRLA